MANMREAVLLPPYDDSVSVPPKQAPPTYTTATA